MGAFGAAAVSIGGALLTKSLSGSQGGIDESAAISQSAIDELKRQFGLVEEDVQPAIELGERQIPGVEQAATVGGLDEILGEIFNTDIFKNLVAERTRGVEGALSAGGLTRSGAAVKELSAIPQDIGLLLESLITGRKTDLFKTGLGASLDLGGLGIQGASAQAGVATQQAGRSFTAGQKDQARQDDFVAGLVGSLGVNAGPLISQAAGFFSDRRLKMNKVIIGKVGSLNFYQWDWKTAISKTFIGKLPTIGFMADEVKKLYPEYVKNLYGFDTIIYSKLLDKIEAETALAA